MGSIDENGVLWNKNSVGKMLEPSLENNHCWSAISTACKSYGHLNAVGQRSVVEKQIVGGFEKFVMSDTFDFITYDAYMKRIEALGSGLASLGLAGGSRVVIYADTQMLWMLSAFASWRQGMVVGTIYATLGEDGAEFGINQSETPCVFADGKLLKILGNIASKCPKLKTVVVFKEEDVEGGAAAKCKAAGIDVITLAALEAKGGEAPKPATPSDTMDTAVLMYTSGTTGKPKGVLISHNSIGALIAATVSPTSALGKYIKPGSKYLAYLPLAHIMELAVEIALLASGFTIGYGGVGTITPTSVKMLHTNQLGDGQALKPDILVAAPAVLDKVYKGVTGKFGAMKGIVKMIVDGGISSGLQNFDNGGTTGASGCLAPIIFKKKVASLLGGNVKIIITGSAPLGVDVQKFMQTVFACPVRQGYGLTETCAGTCITMPGDNGTSVVGPPQECACIKLRDWEEGNYKNSDKDDPKIGMRRGEVLIGGPMVCQGYLENPSYDEPDALAEIAAKNKDDFVVIDGIRYFCTGDVGQYNAQGNLQIIDRKKDLVKLQQGEYVALSKVENVLKNSKYVQLPMCYAKSTMSYCIALVCPNEATLKTIKPSLTSLTEMCNDKDVIEAVTKDCIKNCKEGNLVSFEVPTKIILIDDLWTPDNDMLTAVNKLKRKDIEAKHKSLIAEIYV